MKCTISGCIFHLALAANVLSQWLKLYPVSVNGVIYLWTHVFAGPVSRVGLSVDFQDMVEIVALRRRLHNAVQNGRRTDVLGVEPAAGYSHI